MVCDVLMFKFCYVFRIFEELLPMASIDPMLLPQLLYICPRKELNFLFLRVPVPMSSAFISEVLLGSQKRAGREKIVFIVSCC